jgi:hypothetical protein
MMAKRRKSTESVPAVGANYGDLLTGISDLLDQARRMSARAVNSILTATYWEIGRRVVEFELGGKARAEYGEELVKKLAHDLQAKHGRGFSIRNVWNMKSFYLGWGIVQTPSAQFEARVKLLPEESSDEGDIFQTPPGKSALVPLLPSGHPTALINRFARSRNSEARNSDYSTCTRNASGDQGSKSWLN